MPRPEILKHPGILGPWKGYPPGSVERAKSLGMNLKSTAESVKATIGRWEANLRLVDDERPWEVLGLSTRDEFVEAVTGMTNAEVPSQLDALRKAWRKATDDERGSFLVWIQDGMVVR